MAGVREHLPKARGGAGDRLQPPPEQSTVSENSMEDQVITVSELTQRAVLSALGRKAEELIVLDVRELVSYAQFFIICHGTNTRQVAAIADAIRVDVRDELGELPLGIEGLRSGRWVLVDYGEVVVHIFDEHQRSFYDLEGLWVDAPRLPLPEEPPPGRVAAAPAT
jgi:ribosome-associated protein